MKKNYYQILGLEEGATLGEIKAAYFLVWHRNLKEDWVKAEELSELKMILNERPTDVPKMSDTYLVWSILATIFCCFPFGIAGIVNAIMVSESYEVGNYIEAESYSKKAGQWSRIAAMSGITIFLLIVVIILIIEFSNYLYCQNTMDVFKQ